MDKLSQRVTRLVFDAPIAEVLRPCFLSYKEAATIAGTNYSTFRNWATGVTLLPETHVRQRKELAALVLARVELAAAVAIFRSGAYDMPERAEPFMWVHRTRALRHDLGKTIFKTPLSQVRAFRVICMKQKDAAGAMYVDYGRFRNWTSRRGQLPWGEEYWRLATFLLTWRDTLSSHFFGYDEGWLRTPPGALTA